jgi:hypothetical protein
MAERRKRSNRRRKPSGSGFDPLLDLGFQCFGINVPKSSPVKPETMLMVSVAGAVMNFALSKFFPHLTAQAPQVRPHPEKVEPITTKFDEYQAGRSAVIREVARPKNN